MIGVLGTGAHSLGRYDGVQVWLEFARIGYFLLDTTYDNVDSQDQDIIQTIASASS
jgi:hypothetical protein